MAAPTENNYTLGELVTVQCSVTGNTGASIDAPGIVCKVKKPDGTKTTYNAPTHGATGIYTMDVVTDQAGTWWYRFENASGVVGAGEQAFRVDFSQF